MATDERRYRRAEAALFQAAGIDPTERQIDLPTIGTSVRVLDHGVGDPVLFIPGGPNAAATFAEVAAHMNGLRCLLLDRPGTGLSEPLPTVPDADTLPDYVEQLVVDVLDALALDRAHLVGSSVGGYTALRAAAAHPGRVDRLVLAGCPAFVPGWTAPGFFTLLRTPVVGALVLHTPATRGAARMSLRQMGHQQSLRMGTISPEMVDWVRAWQRDTDTMASDAAMIVACGTRAGGFDPALDLAPDDLARVEARCHILVGTDDIVGAGDTARHLAQLLPHATLEVWDGAGHLPWLDDPARFGAAVASFLALADQPAHDRATDAPDTSDGPLVLAAEDV